VLILDLHKRLRSHSLEKLLQVETPELLQVRGHMLWCMCKVSVLQRLTAGARIVLQSCLASTVKQVMLGQVG
jgi:hypothetical protein